MQTDEIYKYKSLIDRLISIIFLIDFIETPLSKWIYSEISRYKISLAIQYLTEEDLRQELYLYVLELLLQSNKENPYLDKLITYQTIQIVKRLYNYHVLLNEYSTDSIFVTQANIELPVLFNLHWVFQQDNVPLTEYERYILYLRLHKCYDISTIGSILYQDRESIRFTLKTCLKTIKEHYGKN